MTQWIRDHRDDYKIKLVMQEGDIVNNNNTNNPSSGDQTSSQQWPAAQAGMSVLNGYVPYIMAAGNHDFGFTNADNRDTMINSYLSRAIIRSRTLRRAAFSKEKWFPAKFRTLITLLRRPMVGRC